MHSYDNAYAFKLLGLLARSGINVVANPFDNIILQGRADTYPKRRGMARVKELLGVRVNVSLGHDSIMDPWYPLGRGDMLGAASMALHVLQMSGKDEIDEVFGLVTHRAARTLGVEDRYGIEEGKPANLVVFDAPDRFETLRQTPARLHVIKDGVVVASTEPARSRIWARRKAGRCELLPRRQRRTLPRRIAFLPTKCRAKAVLRPSPRQAETQRFRLSGLHQVIFAMPPSMA